MLTSTSGMQHQYYSTIVHFYFIFLLNPWIGRKIVNLLLNLWIKSFLEIDTKPWICEDRELGGRELGGYTVSIYPRNTFIVFFYYMTRTIFTKWSNLLVYWQIVILYFDILGLLSILKSRCRGACIFGWSRGFIHDFDYVGIVTTCK